MDKDELGKKGENIATKYLLSKGYKIIDRNWRFRNKEIDIIAQDQNIVVVVEVKTRSYRDFELPQDAVTLKKQKFLISATNEFVVKHNISNEIRFDIIAIIINNNKTTINHIEDAFYPLA